MKNPVLITKKINENNPFLWRCKSCGEIKIISHTHSEGGYYCEHCADKSSMAKLSEKEYEIVLKLEEWSGLYSNSSMYLYGTIK